MSYESKLDNQSGKLVNPTQLCLLLSVVVHLLVLRFGLPTIRFNNNSGKREVSIIELNAEQQSRLPDLYPQLDTPNVPNLDSLPDGEFGTPAPPFAIPPNLIPGITDPANLPPLIIPPPPQFNIPYFPPISDITLPPVGNLSDLPLPPAINPEDFAVEPIKLPPNAGKIPEQPAKPSNSNEAIQPTKPTTTATKPDKPAVTKPDKKPETEPKSTPQQIAAKKAVESQQRITNLSQSLTKIDGGTSDEDARKNYIIWLAKVKDVEPEQIEIDGAYPRDACIRRLKGSSVFGLVVNAKGEIVALDLIKGAKYPIFNQQASKDLGDRIFENKTEKPKPYQVKVNYEYDAQLCPSLTLPSIRRAEEKQQQVKPETKPTPQPKAQPKPKPTPAPQPQPEPIPTPESANPQPSLRDRLRNVPLSDVKPAKLKDIPLPDRSKFNQ